MPEGIVFVESDKLGWNLDTVYAMLCPACFTSPLPRELERAPSPISVDLQA